MVYKELIKKIADKTGYRQSYIRRILEEAAAEIESSLCRGEKVSLGKFGNIARIKRAARIGRNPKTGEVFPVPSHYEAVLKNGKELQNNINKGEK